MRQTFDQAAFEHHCELAVFSMQLKQYFIFNLDSFLSINFSVWNLPSWALKGFLYKIPLKGNSSI